MAFEILSFKNLIALMCVTQYLVIPVSSLRCVYCMADEDGDCLVPFTKKGYEIECETSMPFRMATFMTTPIGATIIMCIINTADKIPKRAIAHHFSKPTEKDKYVCITAKGKSEGEKFIYKDCAVAPVEVGCEPVKAIGYSGFHIDSCKGCDTDLCNSANNPHIKLTYVLPALAFLHIIIY